VSRSATVYSGSSRHGYGDDSQKLYGWKWFPPE
jgi:hypothetical protein